MKAMTRLTKRVLMTMFVFVCVVLVLVFTGDSYPLNTVDKSSSSSPSSSTELLDLDQLMIPPKFKKSFFISRSPGYEKTTYICPQVNTDYNDLIVLVSIAHGKAYGEDRTFDQFMATLQSLEFNKTTTTLGLLIGARDEYDKILEYVERRYDESDFFSKVIILQSEFIEDLHKIDRDTRHSLNVQKERRRAIARSRNFLVTGALQDEHYTLCLDSDMVEIPRDLITRFIESGKDIAVPRVVQGGAENYDFNTWAGERKAPSVEEDAKMDKDQQFLFVPGPAGAKHMNDLLHDASNTGELTMSYKLDSVGGAILFLKSEVFKQGALFPPLYLVGTKWGRVEGFDGIETEGLCYQARAMGYECWGFPNIVARHAIELQDG